MQTTIEKVSESELKIVTVKPEQIIPEETTEEVMSLYSLCEQRNAVQAEIDRLTTAKNGDMKRYDDVLAPNIEQLAKLDAQIAEAKRLGIVEKVEAEVVTEGTTEVAITP